MLVLFFIMLISFRVETKNIDSQWHFLLKDGNEANCTIDLKEILAWNNETTLFFKVIFYAPWHGDPHNYIDVGIFLDTDQNASTGLNNETGWYYMADIGADYVAVIGWEGDFLWKWSESNEAWKFYQNFSYIDLENSTYYFEIGINLTGIDMPDAIDILVANIDVNKSWYWDYAPDVGQGHVTYFLHMSFPNDSWKKGYVYDSYGNPIKGAYVEIYSDETYYWNETTTNETGYFEFFIPHGNYSIEVNAFGYEPYHEDFSIKENETIWNYVYLKTIVSYPDSYEPDNNASNAKWIECNGMEQTHNFHVSGDEDWLKFNATSGATYIIETSDLGPDCDTYMYLYDSNLTLITEDDDGGTGLASKIVWNCSIDGIYYVMIRHYDSEAYGNDTHYNVSIKEILPYTFIRVAPNYQKVIKNDIFTVNITIEPSMPVTGICFNLSFNASLLEAVSIEEGSLFGGYLTYFNNGTIDNLNGSIQNICATVVNGSIDDAGAMAKITFIAKGVGTSFLNLTNVAVISSNVSLPVIISNGSVEILWEPWDLNHDGHVNVLDLIIVAMHFGSHEGDENYDASVDLNNDGAINVLDLIMVAMHWTG